MKNKILSYDEKETIFKLLDCTKTNNFNQYSLFQVQNNIDEFITNFEKNMSFDDIRDFGKTKKQIGLLKDAMYKIYNSESTFRYNTFMYGILYIAKLVDINQVTPNTNRPVFYSKQIVLDIIKNRDIIKNEFYNVFLKHNYVYDKSHIELFKNNIRIFAFLAIKIKQLEQLKNYLIYNINYLKKYEYRSFSSAQSYDKLLSNRSTILTSLADVDPNGDDYFGKRRNHRNTEYDNDINLTIVDETNTNDIYGDYW